jgi:hypothetical protein
MDKGKMRELAREEVHARIREGAVSEQALEEERREHLGAGHRERTLLRRGWRTGYYTRDLLTPWAGGSSSGYPGTGRGSSSPRSLSAISG